VYGAGERLGSRVHCTLLVSDYDASVSVFVSLFVSLFVPVSLSASVNE